MIKELNNQENCQLMHDERVVAAQREIDDAVLSIKNTLSFEGANAGYFLTILPVRLHRLQRATENYNIVEATVRLEILEGRNNDRKDI